MKPFEVAITVEVGALQVYRSTTVVSLDPRMSDEAMGAAVRQAALKVLPVVGINTPGTLAVLRAQAAKP